MNGHETHTSDFVVRGDRRVPESKAKWCSTCSEHYYTGHDGHDTLNALDSMLALNAVIASSRE